MRKPTINELREFVSDSPEDADDLEDYIGRRTTGEDVDPYLHITVNTLIKEWQRSQVS